MTDLPVIPAQTFPMSGLRRSADGSAETIVFLLPDNIGHAACYRHACLSCLATAALCLGGCTSFSDYVQHGFKVGPEFSPPKAAVAPQWIDAADPHVRSHAADLGRWWRVFNDPVLDDLVYHAYNQNINLKEYGTRILQARAALAIAKGKVFPQTQNASRQL